MTFLSFVFFFFFKQKSAYELRISDWSSDVCSSDLFMVDLATLTGAIIMALGHEHAGLFANNDMLAERLAAAGKAEDEQLWRLPLGDAYDEGLKSPIADMQNIAGPGFGAGSITAAQFLQRRSEEHTSELQSLMRISSAVLYFKKNKHTINN